MTKAVEKANETFPNDDVKFFYEYEPGKYSPVTTWGREKYGFVKGYEQAEKDFINFVHQHYPLNYVGWIEDFNREFGNEVG